MDRDGPLVPGLGFGLNYISADIEPGRKEFDVLVDTMSDWAEELRSENPYFRIVLVVPSASFLAKVREVVPEDVHPRVAPGALDVDCVFINKKS